MRIKNQLIALFAFALLGLGACGSDDNSNPTNNDQNFEIVASPLEINVTLKTRKLVLENDEMVWRIAPWEGGAGKLILSLGVNKDICETDVDEDGNCKVTFPGTMKYPDIIQYVDLGGGLTANPKLFLTTGVHPLFVFKPFDNPATTDIDESEVYQNLIYPKLLSEDNLEVTQNFGFIMAENATLTGTSSNGNVKYNSTYKKGWNIETWKDVNGVTEYNVINQLPAEVVWY